MPTTTSQQEGIIAAALLRMRRGARLEVHVAHALGMPTLPLKLWLAS